MHQGKRHLLLALDAEQRLQHRAQRAVVVGDVLGKLLVQLHGQDAHGLVAGLDAQRGVDHLAAAHAPALGQHTGLDDRVPLLHKVAAGDAGDGDADQPQVSALLLGEGEEMIQGGGEDFLQKVCMCMFCVCPFFLLYIYIYPDILCTNIE